MSAGMRRVTVSDLERMRRKQQPITMVTAYDYPTARLADEAGIPVLLVGDSLGMVVLGYDSTLPVTMEDMIHHGSAVTRGAQRAHVVVDMPFGSYQTGWKAALRNAARLMKETGCSAVKLRVAGAPADAARIRAVADALPAHVQLMADANEKCDLVSAQWLARELADAGALWFEEPLPAHDVNGCRMLARNSPVALATGEHHQGVEELTPLMEGQGVSVIQPDLAMMGGITECLRVAQVAEHYDLAVSPHFLPALFIHLAAAAPAVAWMEDFPLLEPLFEDPRSMDEHGRITPSDGPGHGLAWADGAREEFRSGP